MNKLSTRMQRNILLKLQRGTAARTIASEEKVAINTVRRYRKLFINQLTTKQRMEILADKYTAQTRRKKIKLPCGRTENDCVNCKDIFSTTCRFYK